MTPRDKLLIKAVNDYRIMRQDQVQRLLFPSQNTAQVRLQLLWQHAFLEREFLPVLGGIQTSPILYRIDKKGVALLKRDFGYGKQELRYSGNQALNQRFLLHTLGLGETRLAVELDCASLGMELEAWQDEKALKTDYDRVQVNNRLVAVLPDAYFVVKKTDGRRYQFFIEFDRGVEGVKFFKQKMAAFRLYFISGKVIKRYQTERIRVLTIVEGEKPGKRINQLRKATHDTGGGKWFWFSSLNDIIEYNFFADSLWKPAKGETSKPLMQ